MHVTTINANRHKFEIKESIEKVWRVKRENDTSI